MTKPKLLIYCPAMTRLRGGIERLVADLCVRFSNEIDMHVCCHNRGDETAIEPVYDLPDNVGVHPLNFGMSREQIGTLRKFLQDGGFSHVIVMDVSPVFAQFVLAMRGLPASLLLSEHFDPVQSAALLPTPADRELVLDASDFQHVLLPSYRARLPERFHDTTFVIENAIPPATQFSSPAIADENGRFRVINVARLHFWQKRQDVLIEAFASLAHKHPNWDLHLYGDKHNNADYNGILSLLKTHKIEKRVHLRGSLPHDQLLTELSKAHVFALPSDFEGSPISLAEALISGLPAVGFSDCLGVNEVIKHGRNGYLAQGLGDAMAFAKPLNVLMSSQRLRMAYGTTARETAQVRRPDRIYAKWEALLSDFFRTPSHDKRAGYVNELKALEQRLLS